MVRLDSLAEGDRSNAVPSWVLVAILVTVVVERLLAGDVLRAGFTAAVVAVALVPAIVDRDPTVMPAWPVLGLSALAAVAVLLGAFVDALGYLSVAALGLLVVAEIDEFSRARMPGWFAAGMVVMATMSVGSTWAIVRYAADRWLAVGFATSANALMWDLVVATAAGVAVAVLFEGVLRGAEAR